MVDKLEFDAKHVVRRDYRTAEERARDEETPFRLFGTGASNKRGAGRIFTEINCGLERLSNALMPPNRQNGEANSRRDTTARRSPAATNKYKSSVYNGDLDRDHADASPPNRETSKYSPNDLWEIITSSANKVANRSDRLRHQASKVSSALDDRFEGDAFLMAVSIQIIFAVGITASLSIWLERSIIAAKLSQQTALGAGALSLQMGLDDATKLLSIYSNLTFIGIALIVISVIPEFLMGRLSNRKLVGKSDELGDAIATMLKSIKATLDDHRQALAENRRADSQTQAEVSRAHIAAEEAAILFHEVHFLTDEETIEGPSNHFSFSETPRTALDAFTFYLFEATRGRSSTRGFVASSFFKGTAFGTLITIIFILYLLAQMTTLSAEMFVNDLGFDGTPVLITYPSHLIVLISSILIFLSAYMIGRPLANFFAYAARRNRTQIALSTVRGAVVRAGAPNVRDIAHQVEALNAIFEARLAGATATVSPRATSCSQQENTSNLSSHRETSADFSGTAESTSSWRTAEKERRFVDSGFQAAPKAWLASDKTMPNGRASRKKSRFFS
ncbi:MAG: hypothetical protein AAF720_02215 [Pseudomonadota bacterium]